MLAVIFSFFDILARRHLNYLAFQSFERSWGMLFHKRYSIFRTFCHNWYLLFLGYARSTKVQEQRLVKTEFSMLV